MKNLRALTFLILFLAEFFIAIAVAQAQSQFAGTWTAPYNGGKLTISLDASGSGTMTAQGAGGAGAPKENGNISGCVAQGDSLACRWQSTYSDGDKTITRSGAATLSVSGSSLSFATTVDSNSIKETWKDPKRTGGPSGAKRGGTMVLTLENRPPPPAAQSHTSPSRRVICQITAITGDVYMRNANTDWHESRVGQQLTVADEVQTGPESSVILTCPDGSEMLAKQLTQLRMAELTTREGRTQVRMLLKMGEITSKLRRQETVGSDFSIQSPTATASVRGTVFTVRHDAQTNLSTVNVQEGEVQVTPTNSSLRGVVLRAGQQVQVAQNRVSPVSQFAGQAASGGPNAATAPAKDQGSFQLLRIESELDSSVEGKTEAIYPASKRDFHIRRVQKTGPRPYYISVDITFTAPTAGTMGTAYTFGAKINVQSGDLGSDAAILGWDGAFGQADHPIGRNETREYNTTQTFIWSASDLRPMNDSWEYFRIVLNDPDSSSTWILRFHYQRVGAPKSSSSIPNLASNNPSGSTTHPGSSGQPPKGNLAGLEPSSSGKGTTPSKPADQPTGSAGNPSGPGVAQNSGSPASRAAPRAALGVRIAAQNSAVVVFDVQPGSPAERAGIRKGDTILSLNGAKVTTPAAFSEQVGNMQPGTQVTLMISRNGQAQSIQATLAPAPSVAANVPPGGPKGQQSVTFQGIKPGYNQRPDVEKVLGQPTRNISATSFEYKAPAGIDKIQVDYTNSQVVDRIMVSLGKPTMRSALIQKFKLPERSMARKTSPEGKLVEFFGPPALVAFTYPSANESDGVTTISYYSIAREYQDALGLDPKDAILHTRLADYYGNQKRYDEAIAEYQQAIRFDPNSFHSHNNLGNIYADQKRYDEAAAEYRQVTKLDPKNPFAYINLGMMYVNSGNKTAAMEQYNQVQRLDPTMAKQLLDYINKH